MSDKKQWRVVGVLGTQVGSTADELERTMNKMEWEGYEVQPVIHFGGHFIVIGKRYKGKKGKPEPTKAPGAGKDL